jgi:hypothetical protein
MKRLLTLFFALGIMACAAGLVTAQEQLTDPGMNAVGPNGQLGPSPNAPWVLEASRGATDPYNDGAASEGFADVDGGGFGLFFKAFTGNPPWDPTAGSVDVDIYQDVDGTPGMKYILTGWWGSEPNWSGHVTAGSNAGFALDFLGAGGVPLGSAELDLEPGLSANLGNGNPLNYAQFMVMAIAPPGTETVRARGSMYDGVFNMDPGQALVTDLWSLECIPEPTSMMLVGLAIAGFAAFRRRNS